MRLPAKRISFLCVIASVLSPLIAFSEPKPSVSITVPSPATGTVQIYASATVGGVDRVDISVDGVLLKACYARQCAATWNTAGTSNGQHSVQGKAVLNNGRTVSTAQTVTVANPDVVPVADIASSALTLGATTLSVGSTTSLKATVSNLGTATAQTVAVAFSLVGGAATSQIAQINVGTLSAGASGTVAATLTAPMSPGTYTVIASATTPDAEANTANNTASTLLGVSTSTTSTTTYYVSKSGNDANSCVDAQTPSDMTKHKLTINAGLRCMTSGNTLIINDGIYDESITNRAIPNGEPYPGKPTTVRALNQNQAIVRPSRAGTCTGEAVLWTGTGSHNIVIDGLDLDGNNVCTLIWRLEQMAASGNDVTYITFQNGKIHGGAGVYAESGSAHIAGNTPYSSAHGPFNNITLRNSEIYGSQPGNGLWSVDPSNSLIEGNHFHNSGSSCISFHHVANNTGNVVRNNLCVDAARAAGNSGGIGNLFYNNVAIRVGSGPRGGGVPGVYDSGAFSTSGNNGGGAVRDNKFYNNTIYDSRGTMCFRNVSGTNNEFKNNICYGNDPNDVIFIDNGSVIQSNNRLSSGGATNADPEFVNDAAGDFHLSASSPASIVDAGLSLSSILTTDYQGVTRPQGSGVDLGAFELVR